MRRQIFGRFVTALVAVGAQVMSLPGVCAPKYCLAKPQFEDYPTPVLGKVGASNVSVNFRERAVIGRETEAIRETAMKNGVNFAGRFVIVLAGCGMICTSVFLVDARSGKRLDLPFDSVEDATRLYRDRHNVGFEYRPGSALLGVNGCLVRKGDDAKHFGCGRFHFLLKGNRVSLLCKEAVAKHVRGLPKK